MVLGVGAAGGALYLAGWRQPVVREFRVWAALKTDVTEPQKAAVRAELGRIPATDGVKYTSSAEAYARTKELMESQNMTAYLEGLDADSMPQSFELITTGTEFRCAQLAAVRALPGLSDVRVTMVPTGKRPGGPVAC
ncbi:hypothetical protein Ate02nite_51020 [Paractinoplanes tereljensis]|uniref:FtsX extracellular domain-containing protein n=2 Tax=Paractinoplanes tereljensis TaxID=571912 RepID=A0A919TVX7_9ACTN|nr:hypothetical protein Ate02nite_51020 [Actinoplanes tereljensis]